LAALSPPTEQEKRDTRLGQAKVGLLTAAEIMARLRQPSVAETNLLFHQVLAGQSWTLFCSTTGT